MFHVASHGPGRNSQLTGLLSALLILPLCLCAGLPPPGHPPLLPLSFLFLPALLGAVWILLVWQT